MDKPKINEIISRIKQLSGLKTEGEVAKLLGFSQASLSERKDRASIPYKRITEWAIDNGYSLDWILTGEKPEPTTAAAEETAPYEVTPLISPEEKEYLEKLLSVLRNPNTKKAIQENIDTFLKVPRPVPGTALKKKKE